MQIHLPRYDGHGVAPGSHTRQIVVGHGGHAGYAAVELLLVACQVAHELFEERSAVHVEQSRIAENLDIARPAHAFVALRTICRHIQEIAALTPQDVVHQTVQLLVACDETACLLHIRMDHTAMDLIRRRLPALEFHIAEAEEGEVRLYQPGNAVRNIGKGTFRCTQIVTVEPAFPHQLGKTQRNHPVLRRVAPEGDPSHHVLLHVEHAGAAIHRHSRQPLLDAQLRADARREKAQIQLPGYSLTHFCPEINAHVDRLTVINAVERNGTEAYLPAVVGAEHVLRAVGILNVNLSQQHVFVAIVRSQTLEAVAALIPAVAQQEGQFIAALCHRQFQRLILQIAVIAVQSGL